MSDIEKTQATERAVKRWLRRDQLEREPAEPAFCHDLAEDEGRAAHRMTVNLWKPHRREETTCNN